MHLDESNWLLHFFCLTMFALWVGLFACVVINRLLYAWGNRGVQEAQDQLEAIQLSEELSSLEKEQRIKRMLQRLSRRVLDRVTADTTLPSATAAIFAAHMLRRWGAQSLMRDAKTSRAGIGKWRRVTALRVLTHCDIDDLFEILELALRDNDRDVADSAVAILGRIPQRRAALLLIDALRDGLSSAPRVASHLDRMEIDIRDLLLPLLQDSSGTTRRWGVTLLSRYKDEYVVSQVMRLVHDADADVRGAAALSLSRLGNADAAPFVAQLLVDEAWFVRAHAARALGQLGNADMATRLAPLLGDSQWWVRVAAKESLILLGKRDNLAWRQLLPALNSDDRFARNGAAEILQNLGVVDAVLRQATANPHDQKAMRRLRHVLYAGGHSMFDKAIERAAPHNVEDFRNVLEVAKTDSTRIKDTQPASDIEDLLAKDVLTLDVPLIAPDELGEPASDMTRTSMVSE